MRLDLEEPVVAVVYGPCDIAGHDLLSAGAKVEYEQDL